MGSFLQFIGFRNITILVLTAFAVSFVMLMVGIIGPKDIVELTSSCKCSSVSSGGAVQCIGDSPSSQCQDKYNRIKATVTRLDAKKKIVLGNLTRILNNMLKVFGGGADLNKIQIDVNQGGITNDNHDDVDFDKIYQEMKKSCEEKKRLGKPLGGCQKYLD